MNYAGKVAVVTGGGNGIGRATCLAFASAGAKVVAVDRDRAAADETVRQVSAAGGVGLAVAADVSRSADVQGYVKATVDAFGRIDCFFNNAGIEGKVAPIVDYDEAMFDTLVAINIKGVFLGLKHVLPVMIAQGSGAVVNTASVAGLVGTPSLGPYVASKHAVLGLTKSASGEVARHGVRINAVCPGPVDTRMIHDIEKQLDPTDPDGVGARYASIIPIGRYATSEEIANMVLFLCSDLASGLTGGQYVIDGGRTAVGGTVAQVAQKRN